VDGGRLLVAQPAPDSTTHKTFWPVSILAFVGRPLDDRGDQVAEPSRSTAPVGQGARTGDSIVNTTSNVTNPVERALRSILGRPFAIGRIDASADALWPPVVREEADPPRWRPDLLDTRRAGSDSAR
jgi:hypothetical protein